MNFLKIFGRTAREELLAQAITCREKGETEKAISLYEKIILQNPRWATPYYNLGLIYKYRCDWPQSFKCNKLAAELDAENKAAWWNLAIAATALQDWRTARHAWKAFGLNVEISDDELNMNIGNSNHGYNDIVLNDGAPIGQRLSGSRVRYLCKQCSEGKPHEHHDHDVTSEDMSERKFAFAALDRAELEKVLADWVAVTLCEQSEPMLELD